MKRLFGFLMILTIVAAGCSGGGGSSGGGDAAEVAEYKEAVPDSMQLSKLLIPGTNGRAAPIIGEDAVFPAIAVPVATAVNGVVEIIVTALQNVVDTPYTYFDRENEQVFWGPYDYDGGNGEIVLMVQKFSSEYPEEPDAYAWKLFRVPDGFDLAAAIAAGEQPADAYPVMAGYSQPDLPDGYSGFAMMDLTADSAAGAALGETGPFGEGVFVAAYGSLADPVEPGAKFEYVMSTFRGFRDAGSLDAPLDVDYLYGNLVGETNLTFFNFVTAGDIISDTPALETMNVRMAFLNQADGRAEVTVTGGDVAGTGYASECWDNAINQTYLELSDGINYSTDGSVYDCTTPFESTLDELEMPTTQSPGMSGVFTMLGDLAEGGIGSMPGF
jgi:hypothetical protein